VKDGEKPMAMTAGDKEILADFDRCRDVTIALLKAVPPAMLKRKPAGEDGTIAELFHHISGVVDGWMARCMGDRGPLPDWDAPAPASRTAIVRHLQDSRKRLMAFFTAKGGKAMEMTFTRERDGKTYRFVGRNRVVYLTGHEAHHRGKIVLALRQWGVRKVPFIPFANKPVK